MSNGFEKFVRDSLGDATGNPVRMAGVPDFLIGGGIPGVGNIGNVVTGSLTTFFGSGPGGANLTGLVEKLIGQLIDLVVDNALKALDGIDIDSLPVAMRSGGLDGLSGLSEVRNLLEAIDPNRVKRLKHRIELVENSVTQLLSILSGDASANILFDSVLKGPTKLLKEVLATPNPDPKKLLVAFVVDTIGPKAVLKQASQALSIKKFLRWTDLPGGLPMGKLNKWLNDPSTYLKKDAPESAERQYRARLIAELDSYVRKTLNERLDSLRQPKAGEKTSTEMLVDLICIFFDTSITFALEPDCYPLVSVDWENFEDIGDQIARFSGVQVRSAMRAILGSLPRGIWQWTADNTNLIEGASTLIASVISPIVEGIVRQLVWSIEIISIYPKKYPNTQPDNSFELHRWSNLDTVQNSQAVDDRLEYVAFIRHSRSLKALTNKQQQAISAISADWSKGAKKNPTLKGMVEDIGAYLDVTYHRFRVDSCFPKVEIDEIVDITRADIENGKLVVSASSSRRFELPRPVLRVYYCCEVIPMKPSADPDEDYVLEINIDPDCVLRDVTVLSNRGGKASRRVEVLN